MLTEEVHSAGVLDAKVAQHEDAAHEKRNWVRLTYDCNNKCIFCLDLDAHDGEMRGAEDVKRQILDGRRKGATRLILSGGEPTIHPRYVDFIRLGRLAGYRRIQTVTNGRLFAYQEFLDRCLEAGLQEITFSLHGPNARIHDALVGVKGAFEQESAGLRRALDDGRPIVNVDIVINRGNVKVLPEMLDTFYGWGVREYDLLQVVPFGAAFREGRDILFYDLEEAAPFIRYALEFSERPDVHVWFNRFPPPHLEGYEHLIQDPYKLNDEVRGRKEELARQLEHGEPLDCREPERCRYCYLEQLCDVLEETQRTTHEHRFSRVRIDTRWEASLPPVYGGDPASAKRARDGGERPDDGKARLPVLGGATTRLEHLSIPERASRAGAARFAVKAPDLVEALEALVPFSGVEAVELALDDYAGLAEALGEGDALGDGTLVRATAATPAQAEALLAMDATFEVEVLLTNGTAEWLLALDPVPARLALRQPTYERLTEAAEHDVDLPAFFARFSAEVPVEGVTACVLGRAPRFAPPTLDTAMMREDGRIEIFRYARRYILERYTSKSLRCRRCVHDDACAGLHINQVRAHGYRWIEPVTEERGRVLTATGT
ncbi:MAG TPA: radical SAM protein [Sandaracinaceae bacterium LLY-WYZ-13_1]|nr:radical SAM protein [Sandaracinaceae bacterium LLY-WYZ-13_1]